MRFQEIRAGGQTGADRAAFDGALALDFPIGGWVPKVCLAEDGPIPERYVGLRETVEEDVSVRTRLNVRDSDAALIVFHAELRGGTLLTLQVAEELGKPHFLKDFAVGDQPDDVLQWLREIKPAILNIAGPRESEDPGIYAVTFGLITQLIEQLVPQHE